MWTFFSAHLPGSLGLFLCAFVLSWVWPGFLLLAALGALAASLGILGWLFVPAPPLAPPLRWRRR